MSAPYPLIYISHSLYPMSNKKYAFFRTAVHVNPALSTVGCIFEQKKVSPVVAYDASGKPCGLVEVSNSLFKTLHASIGLSRRVSGNSTVGNALFTCTSMRAHCLAARNLASRSHLSSNATTWWNFQLRCKTTSSEGTTGVQWITFAGFYEKKIIKDFAQSATKHSLTGFLAHGKPALACLEGKPADIKEFIRHVRTTVFATVPRSARKMTLGLREPDSTTRPRRFEGFEAKAFFSLGAHHRPDFLDRKQLEAYLTDHGVPESIYKEIL